MIFGTPEGLSILGDCSTFIYYICDMFLEKFKCCIASYADDNTPFTFDADLILL